MSALATFVASHPVLCFVVLGLGSLLAAATMWRLALALRAPLWRTSARAWNAALSLPPMQRLHQRHPHWLRPPAFRGHYLFMDLATGFVLALLTISLFLALADALGLDEPLARFDTQLAAELHARADDTALRSFALLTRVADVETLTVLCVVVALVLLWRRQHALAMCWVAAVAGNGLLTRLLKATFERSRPLHEHGWTLEAGWSFPSGHAAGAMASYGMLAYLLLRHLPPRWHLPVLLPAIALILTAGYSRIVLQVHYFSDVLAGFASAATWLIVCIAAAEMLHAPRHRRAAPPLSP